LFALFSRFLFYQVIAIEFLKFERLEGLVAGALMVTESGDMDLF
jgi:hypothetical protein